MHHASHVNSISLWAPQEPPLAIYDYYECLRGCSNRITQLILSSFIWYSFHRHIQSNDNQTNPSKLCNSSMQISNSRCNYQLSSYDRLNARLRYLSCAISPPIDRGHCIANLTHISPNNRLRITRWGFSCITNNMEHRIMIIYTGTYYIIWLGDALDQCQLASEYKIYRCSSFHSHSSRLGYTD